MTMGEFTSTVVIKDLQIIIQMQTNLLSTELCCCSCLFCLPGRKPCLEGSIVWWGNRAIQSKVGGHHGDGLRKAIGTHLGCINSQPANRMRL